MSVDLSTPPNTTWRRFRHAYGRHRESEGRGELSPREMRLLPHITSGRHAREWAVRARTFEGFVRRVLRRGGTDRALRILDLGAGNGWLCYQLARRGHLPVALDIRDDGVDGLGAAGVYADALPTMFPRVVGAFDAIPLVDARFDLVVFNASLHYAIDLAAVLREAVRMVEPGGRLAILDSPFYRTETAGARMVRDKRARGTEQFGDLAPDLLELPFVEFLTRRRLAAATPSGVSPWRRHRVRYPWWYEARPWVSRLRGHRPPSRFDVWEALVP